MNSDVWTRDEFIERLHSVGGQAYHHLHPFHVQMNEGLLDTDSIRLWVANRFYYQRCIPLKDAAILANCAVREVRQEWIKRIIDHDGAEGKEGGIEKWIRLAIACGLSYEEVTDERHVRTGVRFAVDAYVNFARTSPWPIAVASSLTELFAPNLMAARLDAFQEHYKWIASDGLDYFRARLTQARQDSEFGLRLTVQYCTDRKMQEMAIRALRFKCDILWSMLDAMVIPRPASSL